MIGRRNQTKKIERNCAWTLNFKEEFLSLLGRNWRNFRRASMKFWICEFIVLWNFWLNSQMKKYHIRKEILKFCSSKRLRNLNWEKRGMKTKTETLADLRSMTFYSIQERIVWEENDFYMKDQNNSINQILSKNILIFHLRFYLGKTPMSSR